MAILRQYRCKGKPDAAAHDHTGNRRIIRPAIHTPPHPRYKGKPIPAYEMIRHSINMHRGCFGGCAFCTISAHQGKFIASRSKESILAEARQVTKDAGLQRIHFRPGRPVGQHVRNAWTRHINIMRGACGHPASTRSHAPTSTPTTRLLDIYHAVDAIPAVKNPSSEAAYATTYQCTAQAYRKQMKPTANTTVN